MRRIFTFLVLCLGFIATSSNGWADQTYSVKVKGMTCSSCEEMITKSINETSNLSLESISHKTGIAKIHVKPGIQMSQIQVEDEVMKALNGTSYTVVKTKKQ